MPVYTPVPAFLAGDTIDEVFLNTYWRDNMAASIPDLFSAKGQLPVGLGVDDMGILNVGANGTIPVADSTESLGILWRALVKARRGGSATNWGTVGTTNYTPATAKVQAGVINVASVSTAFGSIFYGTVTVTFPEAFAQVPIVIASLGALVSQNAIGVMQQVSATQVIFYVTSFSSISNQAVSWIAIGE